MNILRLVLITLCLYGCTERTSQEPRTQNIRPAKIMTVTSQSDEVVHEFSARIEALQSVDLSFQVGGPLAEQPIREGETLSTGSLIASLDPTDFKLAVREAEVQLRLAAQDLNRKRKVLAENGIAKSHVEDARSHYELQKVRLSRAKEQLEDSQIHAPFKAYVSRRYFDRHVNVRPGEPIVRLHDLTSLQVVINIPEYLLATVNQDQVIASWAEFPFAEGEKFTITYHENRGEAAALAQTYEVSFTMDRPERWNILPGMTATARVHLRGSSDGQILIPASSLVPVSNNNLSVWVYDPESHRVSRRQVETGPPTKDRVPVLKGLKSGDQIVVTGASQLHPGMQVSPL
ncbi:MAG: efflux RND transporter periplasmic adaptor subunit [Gammaproteobacteria bacterium]|nr:efflux RND transporter periplasmic adaptor subunit [Gammaproteobacteria bacterium]MBT4493842.1 efflux RND transporter periplasmic adaptor subunit [Gammaproteobacteria bacterium]